jgi:hypothetical protein
MYSLVQENNQLKMKYYELLSHYNKIKDEYDTMRNKNHYEIEHLNKINSFLKHKNVELNKTIIDRNKHILYLVREKR